MGYPHPDYLLAQLTASQLAEWMAYASIEPFGEYREEVRHGQQMALTANINRDFKQRPTPFSTADFMNFIVKPEEVAKAPSKEELSRRIGTELFKITG